MVLTLRFPYLSSYYNWLVLDNLTLSDAKINNIEKIFYGEQSFKLAPDDFSNQFVGISKVKTNSKFDKAQNAWISWVDLELKNNTDGQNEEYVTSFNLPVGCWINDYYLYVDNKKEMGLLAEKKTAMWVFSQIRNYRKDPGILYYQTGNRVTLRVYPFNKNETRKTGISFIHKEPITIKIDSTIVALGNNAEQSNLSFNESVDKNVIYVSAKQKSILSKVNRKPYYHFLVDVSKGKENLKENFEHRIESLLAKKLISADNAKISFVNAYVNSFPLNENWKQNYSNQTFEGGFYLDRAIKTVLFDSYKSNSNTFPLIVTVTDSIQYAIVENDFSDLRFTYPESNLFNNLADNGLLNLHSLSNNPTQRLCDTINYNFQQQVLVYPDKEHPIAYLADNNEADIVLKKSEFEIKDNDILENNWQSALAIQGKWYSQLLHPETSAKEWLNGLRYSFKSKIMSPATSYLVVENDAQKAILKKKQNQVLSSNKSLDLAEDAQRMSEPGLLLMLTLIGLLFLIKGKRKLLI